LRAPSKIGTVMAAGPRPSNWSLHVRSAPITTADPTGGHIGRNQDRPQVFYSGQFDCS
jgi:hypothetical protein